MGTTGGTTPTPLTPASLADALFTPVQQRVLGWLFGQPERRFQSGELIRLAKSGTGAVHRLLTKLAQTGLVTVEDVAQHFRPCQRIAGVGATLIAGVRGERPRRSVEAAVEFIPPESGEG